MPGLRPPMIVNPPTRYNPLPPLRRTRRVRREHTPPFRRRGRRHRRQPIAMPPPLAFLAQSSQPPLPQRRRGRHGRRRRPVHGAGTHLTWPQRTRASRPARRRGRHVAPVRGAPAPAARRRGARVLRRRDVLRVRRGGRRGGGVQAHECALRRGEVDIGEVVRRADEREHSARDIVERRYVQEKPGEEVDLALEGEGENMEARVGVSE